ncbi:MAG: hypothetical protein EXR69_05950 [Myxococcales bacterium]|nr:hypothetical protein [Myxococcales bacterium]
MLLATVAGALALATDPALLACPGTQPCDGVCISWAELCATAVPAPVIAPPTSSDFCGAGPLPRPFESPPNPDLKKAAQVVCTAGTIMGAPCDYASPLLREPPKTQVPPCGGPPIPPAPSAPSDPPKPGTPAPKIPATR